MLKKKLTSIALTGALAVSLLVVPVSAAEVQPAPDEAPTEAIDTNAIEEIIETAEEPEDVIEETSEDPIEGTSPAVVEDAEVMDSEVGGEDYGIALFADESLIELASDGGELASGNYFLSKDVTLEEDITIPEGAEVTIDLNGYALKGTGNNSVITNNGTFTLNDSSEDKSGNISGPTSQSNGVAIGGGVYNCSNFTMNGGTILNTVVTEAGGGVYNAGTMTMTGGELINNTAKYGGGIATEGTLNLKGSVVINGNSDADGPNNIYLYSDCYLSLTGALTGGASVGITTEIEPTSGSPVQITETETDTEYYKTSVQYISSDAEYSVVANETKHFIELSAALNGVCKASDGKWYYYVDGVVDTSYTGFATNENGSWYMENGVLLRDQNTVIKDDLGTLGPRGSWYYVVGSKVQYDFTGLANYKNDNGWYYITDGKVDRSYNGLAKNNNGWYYLTNGKVDRSYTGFAKNENGSWYVTKGKLTRGDNTVLKDENGAIGKNTAWYYVIGSKVQYDFTGLANYKNENGWWYITNGKVDRNANTVAKNKNGWYYVVNGKVQKSFTGLANYKNENGWWYITNGRVDRSYKGLAKNKNGWFYLQNGKVDRSFTGLATNSNGTWYVKSGRVQKSFTGTVTINGTRYSVTNGKVKS